MLVTHYFGSWVVLMQVIFTACRQACILSGDTGARRRRPLFHEPPQLKKNREIKQVYVYEPHPL